MKCEKIPYKDKTDALKGLHSIKNRSTSGKIPVRAYKCYHCSAWHLTSQVDYATETRYYHPKKAEIWNDMMEKQEIKEMFWTDKPFEKQIQKALSAINHNIDVRCKLLNHQIEYKLKNLKTKWKKIQSQPAGLLS